MEVAIQAPPSRFLADAIQVRLIINMAARSREIFFAKLPGVVDAPGDRNDSAIAHDTLTRSPFAKLLQ
ncbi:TPA: hypothetical protein ACKPYP_006161, partial [Pseudomonas aeruginosa]